MKTLLAWGAYVALMLVAYVALMTMLFVVPPTRAGESPCATAADVRAIVSEISTQPHYLCRIRRDGRTIRCKGLKVIVVPNDVVETSKTK